MNSSNSSSREREGGMSTTVRFTESSYAKQAEQLKRDGNTYFNKQRFGAAIDAYTEAITLCPDVAVYWTNRAICHRKRNEWSRVQEDCRKAIQLDTASVKAHYMLGLALLQMKDYVEGVKELEKWYQSINMGPKIDSRIDISEEQMKQIPVVLQKIPTLESAIDELRSEVQGLMHQIKSMRLHSNMLASRSSQIDEAISQAHQICANPPDLAASSCFDLLVI